MFGTLSDAEICSGTLSTVASFLVVLTYYIFPDLRKLRYVELCTYGKHALLYLDVQN